MGMEADFAMACFAVAISCLRMRSLSITASFATTIAGYKFFNITMGHWVTYPLLI